MLFLQVGVGISALQALTNLTFLGLGCTHLSNAELAALRGLLDMRILVVNDTQIGDAGEFYLQLSSSKSKDNLQLSWTLACQLC